MILAPYPLAPEISRILIPHFRNMLPLIIQHGNKLDQRNTACTVQGGSKTSHRTKRNFSLKQLNGQNFAREKNEVIIF